MKEDKISIIVPIYNVEKYLPRCIESLINQTYNNTEILLIDDGSKDKSSDICDYYTKKYNNINTFHKKNGGLSDARNYGINRASGKYIAFVDSDDFVDKDYCRILHKNLIENNADMSICNIKRIVDSTKIHDNNKKEIVNVYSTKETQKNLLNYSNNLNEITTVAWNKLYKKELWNNIRYPKGKINEDEFVIHYLIDNSKKIVYSNLNLYYYYQREGSIMKSTYSKERLAVIEAFRDRWQFYSKKKEYKDLESKAYCAYMKMIIKNYFLSIENNLEKKVIISLRDLYKKDFKEKVKISIVEKIKLLLFYISPKIFNFLQKKIKDEKN